MNLKARLKAVETKLNPPTFEPVVMFLVGVYPKPKIKPPLIGYRHENDVYMRLAGESDNDLKARVELAALEYIARPDNSFTGAMVFEILEGDLEK
jgi:hypothetical protein